MNAWPKEWDKPFEKENNAGHDLKDKFLVIVMNDYDQIYGSVLFPKVAHTVVGRYPWSFQL